MTTAARLALLSELRGGVIGLTSAYLCMAANGTPDYPLLGAADRETFEHFVSSGLLLHVVEEQKQLANDEATAAGHPLPTSIIGEVCAARVRFGEPLPQADRDRLSCHVNELIAVRKRIETARRLSLLSGDSAATDKPATAAKLPPPIPRSPLLTAVALTEALGLPPDRDEAVAAFLRRLADADPAVRDSHEAPRKGEPHHSYRVPRVWPALLEQLPRWNPVAIP
jgi:hypothetical protein